VPDVITGGPTGTNLVRAKRNTSASSGASGQREYLMLNVDLVIFDVAVEFHRHQYCCSGRSKAPHGAAMVLGRSPANWRSLNTAVPASSQRSSRVPQLSHTTVGRGRHRVPCRR
jgi:hypothetical protein